MAMTLEQLGMAQLSVEERLELIGLLWDSMPSTPLPEWHLNELVRRREFAEAHPHLRRPWGEVKANLLGGN